MAYGISLREGDLPTGRVPWKSAFKDFIENNPLGVHITGKIKLIGEGDIWGVPQIFSSHVYNENGVALGRGVGLKLRVRLDSGSSSDVYSCWIRSGWL